MSGRRTAAALCGLLLVSPALGARPAAAQGEEATVQGAVSGTLARGSRVTFTVTATHPQGWGPFGRWP